MNVKSVEVVVKFEDGAGGGEISAPTFAKAIAVAKPMAEAAQISATADLYVNGVWTETQLHITDDTDPETDSDLQADVYLIDRLLEFLNPETDLP